MQTKYLSAYLLPFCILLVSTGIVGCSILSPFGFGGDVTKIKEIPQTPNAAGTVYLQGKVTTRAPFLTGGAYQLQDGTGTIWVITKENVPNVGDQVSIKGQLRFQSLPVSGQELGEVSVQEEQVLNRQTAQSFLPQNQS
ncbi:MAG: hypothetical protein U7123_19990 [Potamolinea sp.]